jgi:hypothetical protein
VPPLLASLKVFGELPRGTSENAPKFN